MKPPNVERMHPPTARRVPARPGHVRNVVLGAGVCLLVLAGCGRQAATAPQPAPTPLANLNTARMQLPRIDFCKLVPDAAVREALGGPTDDARAYGNGDEESVGAAGGKDVLHELGCVWHTASGSTVRTWVFARPVTPAFAKSVITASNKSTGCEAVSGPTFGDPSYTQQCELADGTRRVRHAGLFGQTWLTCEVTAPGDTALSDVRSRADAWSVAVANTLNTTR